MKTDSSVCIGHMASNRPQWNSIQCFGVRASGETVNDADIISAMDFDTSGNFLATGDKGGRVVLFERSFNSDETDVDLNLNTTSELQTSLSSDFR